MYATVYRQHFTLNLKIQRAFANMVLARIRTKCHRNESQNGEQRGSTKKKVRKRGNEGMGLRENVKQDRKKMKFDVTIRINSRQCIKPRQK